MIVDLIGTSSEREAFGWWETAFSRRCEFDRGTSLTDSIPAGVSGEATGHL
jgi:hypothetical protein